MGVNLNNNHNKTRTTTNGNINTNNTVKPVKNKSDLINNNNNNMDDRSPSSTQRYANSFNSALQNNQTNIHPSQLPNLNSVSPLLNQQAAIAALSASLFSQNSAPNTGSERPANNNNNNNIMSLFNNPQLFMAMAAAASTMTVVNNSNVTNAKKTLPQSSNLPPIKYSMSNSNDNN